jgi:signal transduction histidine kinase/ActR/RegA family two-component response regulator
MGAGRSLMSERFTVQARRTLVVDGTGAQGSWPEQSAVVDPCHPLQLRRCFSLDEAVRLIEDGSWEAILLVLAPHDGVGVEGVHRLRRVAPDTPVIVLVDDGDQEPITACLEAGAAGYWFVQKCPELLGQMVHAAASCAERARVMSALAQADRLTSMGLLAGGIAHELNNPLFYARYHLESVAEELPLFCEAVQSFQARVTSRFGLDEVAAAAGEAGEALEPRLLHGIIQRLNDVTEGVQRIQQVANGLTAFTRVDQRELTDVDLLHVLELAATMAANEIQYRARLVKQYRKVPVVRACEGQLAQVFLNLLVNAAHAIDEGNVEEHEIRVSTWVEGAMVCGEVRDNGPGIAPENLPRVFEPFFTTKELGTGSGLGLTLAKNIVDSYDGELVLSSEPGWGTCCVVRLPAYQPDRQSCGDDVLLASPPRRKANILVVDDDEGIRLLVAKMLRAHEVTLAESGTAALQRLKAGESFDLVLCDVMMSNTSGIEVHRWLAEHRPELASSFVFMTGGPFTANARSYITGVGICRLEKPFEAVELKQVVNDLLACRQESSGDS